MYNKCCVDGCGSQRKNIKLHCFPTSETPSSREKWLRCFKSDQLCDLDIKTLRNMFVCHLHFEHKVTTDRRLRSCAYPTLFSEQEIKSGVPSIPSITDDGKQYNHVTTDHCYNKQRRHEDHTYSGSQEGNDSQLGQTNFFREIQNLPTLSLSVVRQYFTLALPSSSSTTVICDTRLCMDGAMLRDKRSRGELC